MINNFLSGFERETFSDCPSCSEPITNPLCHSCLGEEIKQWLNFYPSIKKQLMPKLKKYIIEVNNSALAAVSCASCKKKKAALCPYCFTEGILSILKRNNTDKNVIGDFLTIFNFDPEHQGYISEAIQEGLY